MEKFKKFAARRKWKVSAFLSASFHTSQTLLERQIQRRLNLASNTSDSQNMTFWQRLSPKSPQTSGLMSPQLLQIHHNHHICCQRCVSGHLLVCFGLSQLTQHCPQPARKPGIVYLCSFGSIVTPCRCHLLRLPLSICNTGSFWFISNSDLTLSSMYKNWHEKRDMSQI